VEKVVIATDVRVWFDFRLDEEKVDVSRLSRELCCAGGTSREGTSSNANTARTRIAITNVPIVSRTDGLGGCIGRISAHSIIILCPNGRLTLPAGRNEPYTRQSPFVAKLAEAVTLGQILNRTEKGMTSMKGSIVLLLALVAFAALGTFLMYGLGNAMLATSMPSEDSPFMLAGAICLLAAAYSGVVLLRVTGAVSWKELTVVTSLGVVVIVLAPLTPFPVGCNLQTWFNPHPNISSGCPADPIGTWSTIWPNVLLVEIGLVFASIGLASAKPDRSPVVGAGMGLIMGGLVLMAFGSSFTYITMCPEGGCPPLTSAEWWSLFWPNVLAQIVGASQIVVGSMACFIALRKQRVTLSMAAAIPVSEVPSTEAQ
jgi:hypothetical protein